MTSWTRLLCILIKGTHTERKGNAATGIMYTSIWLAHFAGWTGWLHWYRQIERWTPPGVKEHSQRKASGAVKSCCMVSPRPCLHKGSKRRWEKDAKVSLAQQVLFFQLESRWSGAMTNRELRQTATTTIMRSSPNKRFYHSMHFYFLSIGRESTTWPAKTAHK